MIHKIERKICILSFSINSKNPLKKKTFIFFLSHLYTIHSRINQNGQPCPIYPREHLFPLSHFKKQKQKKKKKLRKHTTHTLAREHRWRKRASVNGAVKEARNTQDRDLGYGGTRNGGALWIRHATTQLASGIPAGSGYNSRSKIEDYSAMPAKPGDDIEWRVIYQSRTIESRGP